MAIGTPSSCAACTVRRRMSTLQFSTSRGTRMPLTRSLPAAWTRLMNATASSNR
ncbi:Uncharacterised protein [Bordetella pertussis]|nr:Uncharacterised protein [Bordetella pertussis]